MAIISRTLVKLTAHLALKTRVDGAEINITSLDGRLDSAETALTTLESRVDATETSLAGHETRLDALDTLVVNNNAALDGRLDSAEQDLAQHDNHLSILDVEQTAQDNVLSNHDSRITHIEQTLAVAGRVSATVTITNTGVPQEGQPGWQQEVNLTTMGRKATLHRLQWTAAGGGPLAGKWRIRLYNTDAARDADTNRHISQDPAEGSGCALEYIVDETFSDSLQLSGVQWANMDHPTQAMAYWLFDNLTGLPSSLILTVTLMIEEA